MKKNRNVLLIVVIVVLVSIPAFFLIVGTSMFRLDPGKTMVKFVSEQMDETLSTITDNTNTCPYPIVLNMGAYFEPVTSVYMPLNVTVLQDRDIKLSTLKNKVNSLDSIRVNENLDSLNSVQVYISCLEARSEASEHKRQREIHQDVQYTYTYPIMVGSEICLQKSCGSFTTIVERPKPGFFHRKPFRLSDDPALMREIEHRLLMDVCKQVNDGLKINKPVRLY